MRNDQDDDYGIEPLLPGDPERIGAYRLLGRLGAGGMGRVYLARSEGGRTVAVKVVQEQLAADPAFRARFRREIKATRQVSEEFTAPVLDAEPDVAGPWVATGYVPGPSLEQAVRSYGPLRTDAVLGLADGMVRALSGIHEAGIVHRDLKPSNVMLTVHGPKIIDFGIARAVQTSVESLLTSTGMVIGSPGFMAPEQVLGDKVGTASDVFALGCVLTYAATGRLPFGSGAANQHAVMYQIVESPPDLEAVGDVFVREFIAGCLTKAMAERPGLEELAERIRQARGAGASGAAGPADSWLPPELVARIARQTAAILDRDVPPLRSAPSPNATGVVGAVGAEGAEDPAESGRPTESAEPSGSAGATGWVESAGSPEAAESAEVTEAPGSAESAEPSGAAEAARSAASAESTAAAESAAAAESTGPAEPTEVSEPARPARSDAGRSAPDAPRAGEPDAATVGLRTKRNPETEGGAEGGGGANGQAGPTAATSGPAAPASGPAAPVSVPDPVSVPAPAGPGGAPDQDPAVGAPFPDAGRPAGEEPAEQPATPAHQTPEAPSAARRDAHRGPDGSGPDKSGPEADAPDSGRPPVAAAGSAARIADPATPPPAAGRRRSGRRRARAVVAAVVAVLVIGGGVALLQRDDGNPGASEQPGGTVSTPSVTASSAGPGSGDDKGGEDEKKDKDKNKDKSTDEDGDKSDRDSSGGDASAPAGSADDQSAAGEDSGTDEGSGGDGGSGSGGQPPAGGDAPAESVPKAFLGTWTRPVHMSGGDFTKAVIHQASPGETVITLSRDYGTTCQARASLVSVEDGGKRLAVGSTRVDSGMCQGKPAGSWVLDGGLRFKGSYGSQEPFQR